MNIEDIYRRYQELQVWVGWTEESARRVAATAELLTPHLTALIDDFYDEIGRHPNARKVITGGQAQINRLTAEQRQRIFEPFFTTKTKGTGLGRAIAQRILEAHGGRIAVGTPPGPGAEIQLLLPRGNS